MKKLFSIALVIALAVSCLAIFPAAEALGEDSYIKMSHSIDGNVLTLRYDLDGTIIDPIVECWITDWYVTFDSTQLRPFGLDDGTARDYVTFEGYKEGLYYDIDEGLFGLSCDTIPYDDDVVYAEDGKTVISGRAVFSITIQMEILAAPGTEVVIKDDESISACGNMEITFGDAYEYKFTVPAAETEAPETEAPETDAPETEAPETEAPAPTYENPAKAEYQTLAGCEVCGTAAGVRFIATVDAAADVYGMEISANGITRTLSSTDAGFKTKAVTADTITFTAVIFSDLTFEVVVFETYGDVTVKSEVGTN